MTEFYNNNGQIIPLPTRKPDQALNGASSGGQSFWGRAGDFAIGLGRTATQIFVNQQVQKLERRADVESAEHMAELRRIEGRANEQRQQTFLGFDADQQKQVVGFSSMGAVVLLGAAAVLIALRS